MSLKLTKHAKPVALAYTFGVGAVATELRSVHKLAAGQPLLTQQMDLAVELPLIASEERMRCLFNERWAAWHRARSYEEAVKDPLTKRLLALAVAHMEKRLPRRGAVARRKPARDEATAPLELA